MKTKDSITTIVTSFICLTPAIFALLVYDQLPSQIPIHFNNGGNADNYMPKNLAAFGLPVIMLLINIYTHFRLNHDPKIERASTVIRQIAKWIVPTISLTLLPYSYARSMGMDISIKMIASALPGLAIIVCGNYLPKCRQNYTVGIKLPWTLHSETNWNKTHRFAGFLWVVGGLVILVNAFLSFWYVQWAVIGLLVIVPILYSYLEYKTENLEKDF